MKRVAVLVSGGVDSSVALYLLKNQGYEVSAFYLKIWLEDELAYLGNCPWQEDIAFAESVCKKFDIPFTILSLQEDYWNVIVAYTINEVRIGRTPSPDILCNQHIKFGCFFDKIDLSFDYIATGHYAQVEDNNGIFYLKKSVDTVKDQTYFLSRLDQKQLSRALFPIGHLTKSEVRAIAHDIGLSTATRKDSQGICFLGKIKFSDFIKHHLGASSGTLIEYETGLAVGIHDGFWYYTIGQRKGIGLSGGPWFVVKKDIKNNYVYISKNYYAIEHTRDSFFVEPLHWISNIEPQHNSYIDVKVRHGEFYYQGLIEYLNDHRAKISFNTHDQGLAPGQFAVFYDKNICLGSGIITD